MSAAPRPAPFVQPHPRLDNLFLGDWLLRSLLQRKLPRETYERIEGELVELGALAAGPLASRQLADLHHEPVLTQWDAWGNRVDTIELTPLWREAERLAARFGLTAVPYERTEGAWSRLRQFALVYLFHPVTDVYTCPLAMTDGAARTLLDSGNRHLIDRAVPHLTHRDPAQFWTSGQWMTESVGGSDVGRSETVAERDADGTWRLYGRKWFTSAATSQVALTLARPSGNGPGGNGLAMFYVECRDADGRLNGIRVDRLKDKLGTRKVPTAELTLDGARAELVMGASGGTRAIEPMLKITRTWNSIAAASFMRHGHRLAADYASRRVAFGSTLATLPLHADTLADLDAECAGATMLAFLQAELLGHEEAGLLDEDGAALLRVLTPLVKLTTGKQAVAAVAEAVEAFGGAGYVEDTGLPVLLRDTLVLPIWEGTTNVLSLDLLLRADVSRGLAALERRVAAATAAAPPGTAL
ncbi:MAG: acyl-CoA dehydrogenase family protein, partial [Proteobacteria bacterium]|nr:acyl-CoA dehydrogenase family protein [Pseudomonadota bacterium]